MRLCKIRDVILLNTSVADMHAPKSYLKMWRDQPSFECISLLKNLKVSQTTVAFIGAIEEPFLLP